jgi:hypothetical protein
MLTVNDASIHILNGRAHLVPSVNVIGPGEEVRLRVHRQGRRLLAPRNHA